MSWEPKISVIIPIYNTAEYLPRCLDSILHNTYQNLEVICINDGSTDDSATIMERYAAADPRVMAINKANAGVSVARNTGLDMATGDFVAFVDSDDWVHPQYFELLMCAEKVHNADCVICGVQTAESQEHFSEYHQAHFSIIATEMHSAMTGKFGRTNIWARIYRKSLIEHIRFPVGIQIAEDTIFNLNVLCIKDDIKIICIGENYTIIFKEQIRRCVPYQIH